MLIYECFDVDNDRELEDPIEIETDWSPADWMFIAEEAAKQLMERADGELSDPDCWPITITVKDKGKLLGTATVYMRYHPYFSAYFHKEN